jgi:hypothetical protein
MNGHHRMYLGAIVLLVAIANAPQALAQRCGVERWAAKTGTDPGAAQVDLANPKVATIADLINLTPPRPVPKDNSRVAPTETTVFVVNATLTDYKFETGPTGDSDYHLVLADDQGHTMVAEIPSPNCVGVGSPFAAQIASARATFDSHLTAGPSFQTANVPVQVTGVGFFDFAHGQKGAAKNVIELHPILDILFSPSAGTDFSIWVTSPTVNVLQGGTASIAVSASTTAGTLPTVTFGTSGLPTGVSSLVTPGANGQATVSLTASTAAAAGSFPFTISGTADARSHSQTLTLNVTTAQQPTISQEWEYQVISANSEQDVITQANALGAQNWEMLSVVQVSGTPGWRAFFRRPKHF